MNVTDPISQFFLKFTVGDLSQYGIERPKEGPRRHMKEKGRTPILDIGTVEAVRKGQIKVVKGLKKTKDLEIEFLDGSKEEFDAIVLATGYSPGLEKILPENKIYFGLNKKKTNKQYLFYDLFLSIDKKNKDLFEFENITQKIKESLSLKTIKNFICLQVNSEAKQQIIKENQIIKIPNTNFTRSLIDKFGFFN